MIWLLINFETLKITEEIRLSPYTLKHKMELAKVHLKMGKPANWWDNPIDTLNWC